jgi:hypothetical protein
VSKVKNISGGQLDVPLLNAVIDDGAIVDVPDFQQDGTSPIVWPADKWEPVAEKKNAPPVTADPVPEPVAPGPPPPPPPVSSDPRER